MMRTTSITRQDLYRAVWATPVEELARRYGISDVALSRLCRQLTIATPPRGFWAKPAAVRERVKPKIRPDDQGAEIMITITASGVVLPKVVDREIAVPVKPNLRNPHSAIAALIDDRRTAVARYRAERKSRPWMRIFQVKDFTPLEKRSLRIRSALFIALEARGCRVDYPGNIVRVSGEDVQLSFGSDAAAGTLQISVKADLPKGTQRLWADGKRARLEETLSHVASTILEAGERLAAETKAANKRRDSAYLAELEYRQAEHERERDERRRRKLLELIKIYREREAAFGIMAEISAPEYDPQKQIGERTLVEWLAWAERAIAAAHPVGDLQALFEAIERT